MTRSHDHTTGHKPHDKQKNVEVSGSNDVISCAIYIIVATTRPMSNRSTSNKSHRKDI